MIPTVHWPVTSDLSSGVWNRSLKVPDVCPINWLRFDGDVPTKSHLKGCKLVMVILDTGASDSK